ncbi:glycosyl transferase [Paenibacillus sp. SSG-1]|uniref:tetratricopeptide repeat-containing glycosyltransferase family 2 protein n=1 Tax=Paenibacillus sp. SSG-1 TaxID=1443669 RepID=UPI000B7CC494|nr:glycosyltransferase [Paenibacillus sp. SSG-1]OXL86384.1 glycosyl transferase [Paenibacillus sp. SSG-1]
MITISLCMIVKNEEHTLERCLSSVSRAVDQIIIVDTGSTDGTRETARKFTDDIHFFDWIDDFSAARNFSFSLATCEYILWLDADDILLEEDQIKLIRLKESLDRRTDSVTMLYHLGSDPYGNVTVQLRRNRLVKRSQGFRWTGTVHEYLEVSGRIVDSDIAVTHRGDDRNRDRNLSIYLRKLSQKAEFTPRDTYYFANELMDHHLYEMAVFYYEKFLNEGRGWVEDNIAACGKLADCYHALGNRSKELLYTLKSLEYGKPRPEFCCRLGFHYMEQADWETAIFWYRQALEWTAPTSHWGISNRSYATWLPHLQLCVCYDKLGQYETAYEHNEAARRYQPEHPSVLGNKTYLEARLKRNGVPPDSQQAYD